MANPDALEARAAQLIKQARRLKDPTEMLQAIAQVRLDLDQASTRLRVELGECISVARAAEHPLTWEAIGDILGVSKQRAMAILKDAQA